MNHIDQWKYLSQRIMGIIRAGEVYARYYAMNSSSSSSAYLISESINTLFDDIYKYREDYNFQLPEAAKLYLDKFLADRDVKFLKGYQRCDNGGEYLKGIIPVLAAFEAEMSYSFCDTQEYKKRVTERAFIHLDRCIRANASIRQEWKSAFLKGEVDCEKLGAAHLLLHGIWAFKSHAAGERTDLILGEPVNDQQVAAVANALVLTEWKLIRSDNQVDELAEKARTQAAKYGRGSLAGIELTNYRYLVLVSEKEIESIKDINEAEIYYRHINIAVEPSTPSKR